MNNLNQDQLGQVELLYKHYKKTDLTRSEINDFVKSGKIKNPSWLKQDQYKVARGVYSLPIDCNDISSQVTQEILSDFPTPVKAPVTATVSLSPCMRQSYTGAIFHNNYPGSLTQQ